MIDDGRQLCRRLHPVETSNQISHPLYYLSHMTHQPLIFRRQESASSQFRCTCGHLSNHCVRVHAASTLGLILELEMLRQWIQTWWNYSKHICPEIFLCSSQSALWNTKMYLCCVTRIDFILCILFLFGFYCDRLFCYSYRKQTIRSCYCESNW